MKSTLTNAGKKALATACAGILALSLASCSNGDVSNAGDSRKIVGYDEINKEYRESVGKLSWPQDYTPPESMPSDSGTSFQQGWGDTQASNLFQCAWEKEWLNTYSSQPERSEEALKELKKVPEMGFMSPDRADDATRRFFKDNIDKAKLGDPSGIQQDVTANCPAS